ncbi:MAG: dihydroneopterin aldolase, partial [Actinomycetota bacterium]|nr:dihydroneopterin aldolase [Actinomycetota bacterium]
EEEERHAGQRFLFDVAFAAETSGGAKDELAETVDYRDVVACVHAVSDGRRFNLIEALAAAVADALLEQFRVTRVRVRVRKPDVRLDAPVAYAAATVERARGGES